MVARRVSRGAGSAALAAAVLLPVSGDVLAWPFGPAPAVPVGAFATDWGYQGETAPAHWSELGSGYATCAEGRRQSPIDLRPTVGALAEHLSFAYRSSPLSLVNDGRLIWGDHLAGSHLIFDERRYELVRYQFHTPSEHRIDGRAADMEVQLVHRDAVGHFLIVAVMVEAGRRSNSILRRIAEHLPDPGERFYGGQVGVNPLFLLPNDRDHLAYPGSLTVPPCTEGVDWLVLSTPLVADAAVVQRFRQAMGANARPVQPVAGRPVVYRRR